MHAEPDQAWSGFPVLHGTWQATPLLCLRSLCALPAPRSLLNSVAGPFLGTKSDGWLVGRTDAHGSCRRPSIQRNWLYWDTCLLEGAGADEPHP